MQLFGIPVWAACGGWLEKIALPELVRRVVIFSDNGTAGDAAAERAAQHFRLSGRHVAVFKPGFDLPDWNDLLRVEALQ